MENNRDFKPNTYPHEIINFFREINKIPRGSGNENNICEYLANFFRNCGCEYVHVDENKNLIVRKAASIELYSKPMITFQAHMDMVNIKAEMSNHNFLSDQIQVIEKDGWLTANQTSLGADNGIAVAEIMNIFSNPNIKHGPIEALFTTEEETTINGALNLKPGLLHGKYLLNLDSENDSELILGCVGSADIIAKTSFTYQHPGQNYVACKLTIKNASGGHSGVEIHKWRANAIKEVLNLLYIINDECSIHLINVNGGTFRNVIAEKCEANFSINRDSVDRASEIINNYSIHLKEFYGENEKNIEIIFDCSRVDINLSIEKNKSDRIINGIVGSFNGLSLYDFSYNAPNTSANIGEIETNGSILRVISLARSPSRFALERLSNQIIAGYRGAGFQAVMAGISDGWIPDYENNQLAQQFAKIYANTFNKKIKLSITGGGLETAVIIKKYPEMHCVSYGVNMQDVHSPKERVEIKSIAKMHEMIINLLIEIE